MDERDKRVIDLVGQVYSAALDASQWPDFLQSVSSLVGATTALMWPHDFASDRTDPSGQDGDLIVATGFDESFLQSYVNHYSTTNVWAAHEGRHPPGSIGTSSILYPDSLLKRTEFYGDWLHRQDLFYALGGVLDKKGTRVTMMAFSRPEKSGAYDAEDMRVMHLLMPHLRTAIGLHRKFFRLETLAASALGALDAVRFGVIMLSPQGNFLHANRSAHDIVRKTGALKFGTGGTVHAATTSATHKLQHLIRAAVMSGSGKGLPPGGALRLPAANGVDLPIFVSPMPSHATPWGQNVAAAIFCNDPDAALGGLVESLQAVYRMTQAEALLTEALVNGQSLKEFAEQRRTTLNTVRTQLKAATAKVGAKRQVDLVRMVLTGPALLSHLHIDSH